MQWRRRPQARTAFDSSGIVVAIADATFNSEGGSDGMTAGMGVVAGAGNGFAAGIGSVGIAGSAGNAGVVSEVSRASDRPPTGITFPGGGRTGRATG